MSALEMDERTIRDALDVMAHGRATYPRSREIRVYAVGRIRWSLSAREVYSYGSHFPLVRVVRRGRRRPLFVLNGDEWHGSNSRTRDHQRFVRGRAAELGETVVIPFSALDGAGLDVDSIRPIHVRPDANWDEWVSVPRLDMVPRWRRTYGDTVDRSARTLDEVPEDRRRSWHLTETRGYQWGEIPRGADGRYHWSQHVTRTIAPGADGNYSWTEYRHRLGDCLFSAVRAESYLRPARPFERSSDSARVTVEVAWRNTHCNAEDGPGRHETGQSGACIYCGRPLETRVTVRRRAHYLSSFDYQEPVPLYFLAELPRGAGDTVESAIEALAPRAVHAARARSVDVERQGDIFFIRTPLTDIDLAARGIVTRARLTQWTRDARPRRGETGHVHETADQRRRREQRFSETRRAEYRRWMAESYARELASPQKRSARSYGQWNNADGAYLTDGNRARAAWFHATERAIALHSPPDRRPDYRQKVRRAVSIYGTAHAATEVVRVRGGATYVRGTVRHVPDLEPNRVGRPDHRPLDLGRDGAWWLAVRNTVPRQRVRRAA